MVSPKISLFDRSEEISKFASGFLNAVQDGNIYDPQGPYALTSHIRRDFSIPTGTAPITLAGESKLLQHLLEERDEKPTPGMVHNLESAVHAITLAQSFVAARTADNRAHDLRYVAENIEAGLPDIKNIVAQMKQHLVQ